MIPQVIQHIRVMKGQTRPHLMLCDDGFYAIVKFRDKRRNAKELVAEYIAGKLAHALGLNIPQYRAVYVSQFLIDGTPELSQFLGQNYYSAGLHLASSFAGGASTKATFDILPESYLMQVANIEQFSYALAFDKWCANAGRRKAVFRKENDDISYIAHLIGLGGCFCGSAWTYSDHSMSGIYASPSVYAHVTGWHSFEPFLSSLVSIKPETVWAIAEEVPSEWSSGDRFYLESLMDALLLRRSRVHELIARSRGAHPWLFPQWVSSVQVAVQYDVHATSLSQLPIGT